MSRKQTTDFKQWELIADQIQRTQAELIALHTLLTGNVPKTVYRNGFQQADNGLSTLKSTLEDRLAEEHPDTWDVETFYDENDYVDQAQARVRAQAEAITTDARQAVVDAVDEIGPAAPWEIERAGNERLSEETLSTGDVTQILQLGVDRDVFNRLEGTRDGHIDEWEINEGASW